MSSNDQHEKTRSAAKPADGEGAAEAKGPAEDAKAADTKAGKSGAEQDLPPDHLAIDPSSDHFDAEKLKRGVAIRFKGSRRSNIEEYCISEGWVRVQAGKSVDRKGRPLTLKLSGPVEAWYEDLGDNAPVAKA